ncbi:ASKHA domain-containing protein [Rhodobaculum claviforme]|uniref:Drug:proton antiporter n=1 Tax=Rhodobaculum claviforme TaxID=1549854 RepID=A0A934TMH9_9RHOB|nr:ASKHA domain-containing protein [Rhodobaculum claviforme]MBK5928269.1 drug:proton antiporter [Rhodobaculum claviforme]
MADARVVFLPSGRRGQVAPGTSVLAAARALGVDLDSVCGGRGICGRCQIAPPAADMTRTPGSALSPPTTAEARYAERRGLGPDRRLGCQACVQGDVVIDVPPGSQVHRQVVRKEAAARPMEMDPATRLCLVDVAEPDMHDPSGDFERLAKALEDHWQINYLQADLEVLREIQSTLRQGQWRVTAAIHQGHRDPTPRLTALWPGFHDRLYGLAIDLGSTTIAAHLTDLADGSVCAAAGAMNPQIRFGEDLMSRVSHAMMTPGGAAQMTAVVQAALADLARDVARQADVDPRAIVEVVVVCNPVMHHLLLGLDPTELGQAPFALAICGAIEGAAREIGLRDLAPGARAYVLPCIAGHVGADAAAVALAEAPDRSDDLVLVVDVGTNAELLLGNALRVLACSSPTGPAFEGAQITAGQRAAPGAIERVRIDPATGTPRVRVIGCDLWSDDPGFPADTPVTGICGSGIIEAVAEMRMAGLVDASGLIGSAAQTGCVRCVPEGRTHAYVLHDSPRIVVTQADIRAIQLAKSALHAGARLLMDAFGVDRVDRVVLAGAFGAHVSPLHALVLGMIPDTLPERVTSAGNAAGTGARMVLCSRSARAQVEALVRRIHKIETALVPRFQEHFVAANALPHATDPFAALRGIVPLPEVRFHRDSGRRRRDPRDRAATE